jgi:hypothetical protein
LDLGALAALGLEATAVAVVAAGAAGVAVAGAVLGAFAILFALTEEVVEDILNALVMIVTHRGHVNRFRKRTFTGEGGGKSMYYLPLVEYPLQIILNHWIALRWFPFYSTFNSIQKCEWLAWANTVLFQTTFTYFYFAGWPLLDLGFYFLGHVIYDTLFLLMYRTELLMYAHHLLAIAVCGIVYFLGDPVMSEINIAASMLERTNILLGIVWLLNRAGYGKTMGVQMLAGAALVVYVMIRMVYFPYYVLFTASWTTLLLMSVFIPMNAFWSWKLIKYYYHMAFVRKEGGDRLE